MNTQPTDTDKRRMTLGSSIRKIVFLVSLPVTLFVIFSLTDGPLTDRYVGIALAWCAILTGGIPAVRWTARFGTVDRLRGDRPIRLSDFREYTEVHEMQMWLAANLLAVSLAYASAMRAFMEGMAPIPNL